MCLLPSEYLCTVYCAFFAVSIKHVMWMYILEIGQGFPARLKLVALRDLRSLRSLLCTLVRDPTTVFVGSLSKFEAHASRSAAKD